MAGTFPAKYMGSVMAGQAMGGIFPSLVGILVVASQIQPKDSGFSSFIIALVFLVASLLGFIWMTKVPFYK
jgi:NADH:ubiquinone oxidoreductase subunit 3 (subunit A)